MLRNPRIMLLALVVVVVLANVWLIAFTLGRPPARPPLPNPNGYDDFLKAAALLTLSGDFDNVPTLGHDDLRTLVSTNAEPLRLLRLGLTRPCSVPTDLYITNDTGRSGLVRLKYLADLLAAEGRLREMEGQPTEAALDYADAIRLGNEISRGGFIIDRVWGFGCEFIGYTALAKLVPNFNGEQAREVLARLETIDNTRVTWDEIRRNTERWNRYQMRGRFNPIVRARVWWQSRGPHQTAAMKHKIAIAHTHLLEVELALRFYQSEQGRVPIRLDELVPSYLSKVPPDPFSGRPLSYRPQGTNWLLYSVGPDGVDDGGQRVGGWVSGAVPRGDLFYDSPY
jgi:hypothetical protein